MHSHSTCGETRLVSESTHTHGAASASASGDQRIPCQVHSEETVLKAEPRHPVDAGRALLFAFLRHELGTPDAERSPKMRAERAQLKSCKDDERIAQGKRGTSAALGYEPKMISLLFPIWFGAPGARQTRLEKERLGVGWRLPRAAASAALPWAIITPPRAGLRRPHE